MAGPRMTGADRARRALTALAITTASAFGLAWLAPASAVLWIKAFHVIAVISWMAGMLYLPRLFVYHCAAAPGSEASETFKTMEARLLEYIINPAMIMTWVLGLWLAWSSFGFRGGWLHAKLALVFALSGVHGYFAGAVRAFAEDRNRRSARHWRVMNEVPTMIMIAVVILVVVKPF
ncbi:protoporphyrinogen oxidase HemJ [Phreatobacter stygius]|uniref:Protoporphyrinogen IX oxidase n=1 Tax=Phreatobacter stygius TaxID=1940610 RepID=A0A4D7B4F5_9HYPH|nr:protoporphyrinogen oxidase HemJ [Phreatobacter stygius]QCI64930.1 protoporphyrinogen oxidase HemJ [Phreatobacter stygius]